MRRPGAGVIEGAAAGTQSGEEASWRGWAQPKLQTTRTPLAATVLMAIGITIWHIPFFVIVEVRLLMDRLRE